MTHEIAKAIKKVKNAGYNPEWLFLFSDDFKKLLKNNSQRR